MITKKEMKNLLNEIENEYIKCFDILRNVKTGGNDLTSEDLLDFQPILATALFKLDSTYRELKQEKKRFISRKEQFNFEWFKKRMQRIGYYLKLIKEFISIGRSLGDSYAWIFYSNDRVYLNKHFDHELIMHTPPGIGGLGELEFLKNNKILEEHIVLYHGITTFLRKGDFSLISLETMRVSAIGELKSKKAGKNEIAILVHIMGPDNNDFQKRLIQNNEIAQSEYGKFDLPPKIKHRLEKQIIEINSIFDKEENILSEEKILDGYYIEELNELALSLKKRNVTFKKAGDGLLLIGMKNYRKSLLSRMSGEHSKNFNKKMKDLPEYAIDICDKEGKENTAIISYLDPTYLVGSTPLFWWPTDLELIRKIIFREIHVLTIYNPYHLIKKLRDLGYNIEQKNGKLNYKIGKKINNEMSIQLEGFSNYIASVQNHLLKEESLIRFINSSCEKIESQKLPQYSHVNLNMMHEFL